MLFIRISGKFQSAALIRCTYTDHIFCMYCCDSLENTENQKLCSIFLSKEHDFTVQSNFYKYKKNQTVKIFMKKFKGIYMYSSFAIQETEDRKN